MKRAIRRQITLSRDTDTLLQQFAQAGDTTASEVVNDALWSMFTSIRGGTLVDSFMVDGFGRYREMMTAKVPIPAPSGSYKRRADRTPANGE